MTLRIGRSHGRGEGRVGSGSSWGGATLSRRRGTVADTHLLSVGVAVAVELGPGVFVPACDAQAVLDLLHEAATRRRERGDRLPTPVVELAAELARAARLERNRVSGVGTSPRTDTGNAATINHMSTQQVADRLEITDRAVIARLQRGTLDGVKRDGRWVIRFKGDAA